MLKSRNKRINANGSCHADGSSKIPDHRIYFDLEAEGQGYGYGNGDGSYGSKTPGRRASNGNGRGHGMCFRSGASVGIGALKADCFSDGRSVRE